MLIVIDTCTFFYILGHEVVAFSTPANTPFEKRPFVALKYSIFCKSW